MVWFFGSKACRILAPPPGTEPAPPSLKSKEELVHCQHLSLLFRFPLLVVTPWLLRWGQKPGSLPLAPVPQSVVARPGADRVLLVPPSSQVEILLLRLGPL